MLESIANTRVCKRCLAEKSIEDFRHGSSSLGRPIYRLSCLPCFKDKQRESALKYYYDRYGKDLEYTERRRAAAREYAATNIESFVQRASEYKKKSPKAKVHSRRSRLKRKFGLTEAEYEALSLAQGGVCAICFGGQQNNLPLSVDHCHKTGKIRGLLCNRCNSMLGMAGDSADNLLRGAEYLKNTGGV